MSRPNWFPPIRPGTEPADARAILDCQGEWWLWGGPICRQADRCVDQKACYFVAQATRHAPPLANHFHWSRGFDYEPETLSMFEAA
jgi:hypothetical protein